MNWLWRALARLSLPPVVLCERCGRPLRDKDLLATYDGGIVWLCDCGWQETIREKREGVTGRWTARKGHL